MTIVKRDSYAVSKSPVKSAAGTGMLVAGGGGLGLLLLAGILPFITLPVLCVLLVLGGLVLKF